ncbi:MAG: hypothetical protein GIS02_06110 [Methanosarcinales archaeon]|uniref:Uncharacterized protein n=1 Tax=Candidatus Ethanoperedens thermophilum TaxID=2766897 RepID=A0A848DAT0_9EURY|nr:hypothetical protein [Candidatus Ethanoperedens thermophilum]
MKKIRTDDNAHEILYVVKREMKERGIERPTFSDVIRWMYHESHKN